MPPKAYPILAPPSPVIPTEINDDHDVLCVMDMLDTLDSIPGELTQRFGDLRELDAVLNATTVHLTSRLETLTQILKKATTTASNDTVPLSSDKRSRSDEQDVVVPEVEKTLTEEPMKIDQLPAVIAEDMGVILSNNEQHSSTNDAPESTQTAIPPNPEPTSNPETAPAASAPTTVPVPPPNPTVDETEAITIVPDQPWDRFQILLEIAEELSRFKVGVEDKVKVAGSACDHVIQHQSHIASLLSSSTLLLPSHPGSSHTGQAVPGYSAVQAGGTTAAGKRHRNSPMPSRYANLVNTTPSHLLPSGSQYSNGTALSNNTAGYGTGYAGSSAALPAPGSETPSKKRRKTGATAAAGGQQGGKEKKVVGQPGQGDEFWADGDLGGSGNVNAKGGKRWDGTRPPNPFNTDAYPGLAGYPEFPAHLQSAQTGGKRNSPSVAGSVRGGSVMPSTSAGAGAGAGESGSKASGKKKSGNTGGAKKATGSSGAQDGKTGGSTTSGPTGGRKKSTKLSTLPTTEEYPDYPSSRLPHPESRTTAASWAGLGGEAEVDVDMDPEEAGEGDGEADTRLYCYCQKTSFGEMIGCDDDACVYEWFHLSCLRLDRPPEGTWLCPDCAIRSERRAATKKKREVKGKDGAGGRKGK